jgi:hypothetical protein
LITSKTEILAPPRILRTAVHIHPNGRYGVRDLRVGPPAPLSVAMGDDLQSHAETFDLPESSTVAEAVAFL